MPISLAWREYITWSLSWMTALHVTIEFIVHSVKVNYHCMLFGQIFEEKRIFLEGFVPLCWVYVLTECCMVLLGLYLWYYTTREPSYVWTYTRLSRRTWIILLVHLFVLNVLFVKGFQSLCNSLDSAPVCNSLSIKNIEWKYFKPKYMDGSHFYPQYMRIMISSWSNLLSLIYGFYLNTIKL